MTPGILLAVGSALMGIVSVIGMLLEGMKDKKPPEPAADLGEYAYREMDDQDESGIIKTTVTGSKIINHDEIAGYQSGIVETKRIHPIHNTVEINKMQYGIKLPCGCVTFDTSKDGLKACFSCGVLICDQCSRICARCGNRFGACCSQQLSFYKNGKKIDYHFCNECLAMLRDSIGGELVDNIVSGQALINEPNYLLPEPNHE